MIELNRLLVATDLSDPARHAAVRAAMIAREHGASLDLVHVVNLSPLEKLQRLVTDIPVELEQRILDATQEEVRELAAALLRQYEVSSGVHVVSGPLLSKLATQIDKLSADLVVLGAHGASVMRHLLLGSTAERMLRRASCPMLVVKQIPRDRYRTLLVPVDFSPCSLRAINNARTLAPAADILLLHAFAVPFEGKLALAGVDDDKIQRYRVAAEQEALQKLWELCGEARLPPDAVRLMVLHGDPLRHIIQQEQKQNCGLIAMGKHGESLVEDLLLGSVTKCVLTESRADVLVCV